MKPVQQILTVTAAGTPVPLTANKDLMVFALYVQAHWTNASEAYIGLQSLDKTTGGGVIKRLPASGEFSISTTESNRLHLADYFVDAEQSNSKLLVTYWVA